MTNFFKKENRIFDTLNKKQKTAETVLNVVSVCLYIFSAFAFFEIMYLVCNMIGAIVSGAPYQAIYELKRVVAEIVAYSLMIHVSFLLQSVRNARDDKHRQKILKVNGVIIAVLGAFAFIYTVIGYITGQYHKIVDGYTFLFPLDTLILGIVFAVLGVFAVIKAKKITEISGELFVFVVENRKTVSRGFDHFFYGVEYLIALFGFAGFWYSFSCFDLRERIYLGYGITLDLLFILPTLMILCYKFIYKGVKDEYKTECQLVLGGVCAVLEIICFALFIAFLSKTPNAADIVAYGVLPVDFTASVNASVIFYGLGNILPPVVALIKGLILKGKKVKENVR